MVVWLYDPCFKFLWFSGYRNLYTSSLQIKISRNFDLIGFRKYYVVAGWCPE
jgi:hypothetical protein